MPSPKRALPAAAALIIILLHLPVVFSHENYLLTWFNIDDGFYYFVTARNIAAGQGVTFDGIAPTNGFHPLWMLIITPIFAFPGKILPLRILAALLSVLSAGTAVLIYRFAARRLSPGISFLTALAFALLPAIHTITTRGGMEAGLSAFFIALLLERLAVVDTRSTKEVLILSLVAALTCLARLDNIFLAGFVGGWLVLRGWRPPEGGSRSPWGWRVRLGGKYMIPFAGIVVLYMAWNLIGFGTPTPVSGQVKQWWGTLPNTVYGFPPKRLSNYIGQFVTDDPDIGPWSLATSLLYGTAETISGEDTGTRRVVLVLLGTGISSGLALLVWGARKFTWEAVVDLGLLPLLAGCLAQIAYYKVGGSVAERIWYWVPEMLWLVLMGGLMIELAARKLAPSLPSGAKKLAILAITAALIGPHLPRIGRILSPDIVEQRSFYLRRAGWIEANTEPGARIGMTGTGSSAYFTDDRTLINLDGLINSYAYFQHLKAGRAAEYLTAIEMDYVFGNQYIIQESDPYGDIFAGRLTENAIFIDGDKQLFLWQFTKP